MNKRRKILLAGILLLLTPIILLTLLSIFSPRPRNLGVEKQMLKPCPESPNCVCTQASDEEHSIAPIEFAGSTESAIAAIKATLDEMPRVRIVEEQENYLRVEAKSLIFRFVDDVEFLVDEDKGLIHFRSASRAGYSDMGVNRDRMESFRTRFAKLKTE